MRGNYSQSYKSSMNQRASIGKKQSISTLHYTLPEISIQLDSILHSRIDQIKQIAFKRRLLLNITQSSMLNEALLNDPSVQIASVPNHLVGQYIKSVYEKYNIKDPFLDVSVENSKITKMQHQTTLSSPAKVTVDFSRKSGSHQSTTSKKISHIKEMFRKEFEDETPKKNIVENKVHWKQIGYKTNQKIKFKSKVDQQPIIRKQSISLMNKPNVPPQKHQKHIPQIFRYCPMCQEAILQQNIPFHQKSCFFLKQAYKMSINELLKLVIDKIQRLKCELEEEYKHKTEKQMLLQATQMKQNILKWLKKIDDNTADKTHYQKVDKSCKTVALNSAQKASKLNWFLQIKANLQKEISKHRNFHDF